MSIKIGVIGIGNAGAECFASRFGDLPPLGHDSFSDIDCDVSLFAINTDLPHLEFVGYDIGEKNLIHIGPEIAKGLSALGNPAIGEEAARESNTFIRNMLGELNVAIIVAGLGKGTGTGSSYVVAEICSEMKIFCNAVVSLPFSFEEKKIHSIAEIGLTKIRSIADNVICLSPEHCGIGNFEELGLLMTYNKLNVLLSNVVKDLVERIANSSSN